MIIYILYYDDNDDDNKIISMYTTFSNFGFLSCFKEAKNSKIQQLEIVSHGERTSSYMQCYSIINACDLWDRKGPKFKISSER